MRILAIIIVSLTLAAGGWAVPSGLNAMPTADILPFGTTRMDWQLNKSGLLFATTNRRVLGTQTGLAPGLLEGGVDEVSGVGTVYNLKLALANESYVVPAIAVGVQNVSGRTKNQFYLVGSKLLLGGMPGDRSAVRGHLGVLSDDHGDVSSMFGGDLYVGGARLAIDRIGGTNLRQGRTALGLTVDIGKVDLTGIAFDVGRHPGTITLMVSYGYTSGR